MIITPAIRESIKYDFKAKFPEFETTDTTNYLDGLIDDVSCLLGDYTYTNDCDKNAVLYLLAHELKLTVDGIKNGTGESARLANSTSVGSVSESYGDLGTLYGSGTLNNGYLFLTLYGQRFYRLTHKYSVGVKFV